MSTFNDSVCLLLIYRKFNYRLDVHKTSTSATMCRNSSSSSASPSSCAVDGTSNSNQVVSNTRCRDKLQKVILAMKDVSYDIVVKTPKMNVCDKVVKTKKRLLHGINFYARKGTCNAVLGRSGG